MPVNCERGQGQYAEADGIVHVLDDIQISPDEFVSRGDLRRLAQGFATLGAPLAPRDVKQFDRHRHRRAIICVVLSVPVRSESGTHQRVRRRACRQR